MDSSALRVELLTSVKAWRDDAQVDLGPHKQRAVFTMLALRANERVRVGDILASVWGADPPVRANAILHTYVARLRLAVEPEAPRRRRTNVIESTPGGYRLAVAADNVDLLRCRQLASRAEALLQKGERNLALEILGEAVWCWRADIRPELADLLQARETVDALHLELVDIGLRFVTLGLDMGEAAAVLSTAERLAVAEPLHEAIHARYLLALAGTGQRAAAIGWYRELQCRLRAELGIEPGPELASAYRLVISDGVHGPGVRRHAAVPAPRRWRGPGPPACQMVGRDGESSQLRAISSEQRLLTLTGAAGVGKSALALSVCGGIQERFPDGVTVVDLSEAHGDTAEVAHAILLALTAPPVETTNLAGQAVARLRTRRMLLVLDNADRVLDGCAQLLDQLVPFCPGLSVVVTSREILGLPYEAVWPVAPLPVPELAGGPGRRYPRHRAAVDLFERRAAQASPDFHLDAHNAAAVVAICRRLAGLPLILELAAAQLRTLNLSQLARLVRDHPSRLVAHRRARPAHHDSFDRALQWAYADLSAEEKLLLATFGEIGPRLHVHDLVREVVTAGPLPPVTVESCLTRLVDKSWVQPDRATNGDWYTMLEPIHHFARRLSRAAGRCPTPARLAPPLRLTRPVLAAAPLPQGL